MQETINNCARAEDLVAYIYREATEKEALEFESHARHCASCRTELTAFSDVRHAINDWRQHSLSAIATPAHEAEPATAFAARSAAGKPRRSALAALREFFTLSPVWMRAATAVAALLFCALVVIAVAYFTEQPKVIVQQPTTTDGARENPAPQVAGADQQSNQPSVADKTQLAPKEETTTDVNPINARAEHNKRGASASQQLTKRRRQIIPRTLTEPSLELAEANDYLPFTASGDEDKLPSLADLANDDN